MILKRQKTFASATKIVSDEVIKKGVAKEVAKSTEWIKKHPMKIELLNKPKRQSLFSEESGED